MLQKYTIKKTVENKSTPRQPTHVTPQRLDAGVRSVYETYVNYPNLTTLLSEIQWSAHLHILNQTNTITVFSEYQTKLLDKKLLQQKLHELFSVLNNK